MSRSVSTTGGFTGTTARIEDLHTAAQILEDIGQDVDAVIAGAWKLRLQGQIPLWFLSPATALGVELHVAEFGARALSPRLQPKVVAGKLRTAAHAYVAVESFLTQVFASALYTAGYAVGQSALIPVTLGLSHVLLGHRVAESVGIYAAMKSLTGIDPCELTRAGIETIFVHGGGATLLEGALGHFLPGVAAGMLGPGVGLYLMTHPTREFPRDSRSFQRFLLDTGSGAGQFGPGHDPHQPRPVRVQSLGHTTPSTPVRSLKDLLARNLQGTEGEIRVERIRSPNGETRWIVNVPGTTDWQLADVPVLTDLDTNARAIAGRPNAMADAVKQAMRQAGIAATDEVLMVGYSQGGMVAAGLTADPAFSADFNVRGLLTVGAPVGGYSVPRGVRTLSIEHANDPVPHLDGNHNPDHEHWTTVSVRTDYRSLKESGYFECLSDGEIARQTREVGFAHGGRLYEHTLSSLEEEDNASLGRWKDELDPFFRAETEGEQHFLGRQ